MLALFFVHHICVSSVPAQFEYLGPKVKSGFDQQSSNFAYVGQGICAPSGPDSINKVWGVCLGWTSSAPALNASAEAYELANVVCEL